ncbi:MAG: glycosyltransferase family 4 protein [Candidatus Pacebacteria bacterium]|nr:glycosyltransferase family 4 protein [Candidatus Paceibacterota bacterium]
METLTTSHPHHKILYIITKSNFGGAQKYVYELAIEMKQQGYEVAVACGGKDELVDKLKLANITTYEVIGFQRDISIFKEIKAILSLIKIIRRAKPDVVHLNSAKAGLLGSIIARLLRVPKIIFTAHGWPFLEPRTRTWRTMAWFGSYVTSLLSHHIINVSQFDLKNAKMPGILNKSSVIHTAIAEFPLLPREEARYKLIGEELTEQHRSNLWLVSVAELNHNKNHVTAIDAVAEFNSTRANKIFYTIIGSGELHNSLQDQVNLKGLNDYIKFLNYVEDANQYLLAFDIFLLPSKKEGLPYALLEAGLAGLPCIASRVGGIPEVIIDHESGILTDPNNHMTIVSALDLLINYPDQRFLYSENLKQDIQTKFNLTKMVEETKSLYF